MAETVRRYVRLHTQNTVCAGNIPRHRFRYESTDLLIMDDQMREVTQSGDVCDLFTEGSHHRNVSVICMLQNLYYKGKENRTMSLNSSYLVMFKNPRDQQQVAVLSRQMYPNRPQHFMAEYDRATRIKAIRLLVTRSENYDQSAHRKRKHYIP